MENKKELRLVLDYILKANNIPKEAMQNTKRNKIFMFGKNLISNIDSCLEEVTIQIYPNSYSRKKIFEIYQNEENKENEFSIWVRKTPEISMLSMFKKENAAIFNIMVLDKKIIIKYNQKEMAF